MKKNISILIVILLLFSGCTPVDDQNNQTTTIVTSVVQSESEITTSSDAKPSEEESLNVKVIAPYGTPVLSMVKMFVDKPVIKEGVDIEYEAIQATDVLSAQLINHEADIAIVPTNLAATMYNKNIGYKIAGSSVWGTLYMVSSEDIKSVQDLKGKNIGLMGRNLTPDAIFRYILSQNGINPNEDVTLEYFSGGSELATSYISGKSNLSLMPQPVLTMVMTKRKDSSVILDLQEEWSKITGFDSFPQASIIVSEKLIAENPDFVSAFLKEYKQSVIWLNENPKEAGNYYETLNIGLKAKIIEKAIPKCHLNYVPANEAKEALTAYLNVLFEFNPKLLGGKPVDEAMYLNE